MVSKVDENNKVIYAHELKNEYSEVDLIDGHRHYVKLIFEKTNLTEVVSIIVLAFYFVKLFHIIFKIIYGSLNCCI